MTKLLRSLTSVSDSYNSSKWIKVAMRHANIKGSTADTATNMAHKMNGPHNFKENVLIKQILWRKSDDLLLES